jgi:hypothetical protein
VGCLGETVGGCAACLPCLPHCLHLDLANCSACLPACPPVPPAPAPADVTIGSWLLAFNATHFDDRRLCERNCTASSLAVYDIPVCAGK